MSPENLFARTTFVIAMETAAQIDARLYVGTIKQENRKSAWHNLFSQLSQDTKLAEKSRKSYEGSNQTPIEWKKGRTNYHIKALEDVQRADGRKNIIPKEKLALMRYVHREWDRSWKLDIKGGFSR